MTSAGEAPHITCPACGRTSWHTKDVEQGYCGYCHDWTSSDAMTKGGHAIRVSPVTSACPTCGSVDERIPYDIGSGRELSCRHCEWCWGADGQELKPYVAPADLLARIEGLRRR